MCNGKSNFLKKAWITTDHMAFTWTQSLYRIVNFFVVWSYKQKGIISKLFTKFVSKLNISENAILFGLLSVILAKITCIWNERICYIIVQVSIHQLQARFCLNKKGTIPFGMLSHLHI